MKLTLILFAAILFASCQQGSDSNEKKDEKKTESVPDKTSIKPSSVEQSQSTTQETPRMKCLREAQEAHIRCITSAKTDEEKSACNKALSAAERACPPPDPNQ